MDMMKKYASEICEELEGAKSYAECYVDCKVRGNSNSATKFKEMATDELKHASYIHAMAAHCIEEMEKAISIPENISFEWQECNSEYACKAACVKQMLTL